MARCDPQWGIQESHDLHIIYSFTGTDMTSTDMTSQLLSRDSLSLTGRAGS